MQSMFGRVTLAHDTVPLSYLNSTRLQVWVRLVGLSDCSFKLPELYWAAGLGEVGGFVILFL